VERPSGLLCAFSTFFFSGRVGQTSHRTVEDLLDVGFRATLVILHWVFELVPLAVLAVVARVVSEQGFRPFISLGAFVLAVLLALTLQNRLLPVRIWIGSRFTPGSSSVAGPMRSDGLLDRLLGRHATDHLRLRPREAGPSRKTRPVWE